MNAALLDNIFQYWYAWTIGVLLAVIAAGFFARFVFPAWRIGRDMKQAIVALRTLKERGGAAGIDPETIALEAMASARLCRIWAEYAETLHPQHLPDAAGGPQVSRWRATALAETFFTEQALVDSPLKTEFYKHLPGILTGLGIIGTFTGLIIGLVHFDVSLDPTQAQVQLRNLINSVGHAFLVSAVAITLAMLFTWIEKSLLTARYRQVEELRELIDGMFDVGADVEYLERLVVAAETSAAQAVHIKDALAEQLRGILTDVTSRQMEASARHSEQMAADLGRVIGERLGQPIADISRAVNSVSARQEEVVTRLVGEVLAGFSAQMQNMFAAQMKDTGALLRQTNETMQGTATQFAQMVLRMDAAGREAVDAMGERVSEQVAAVVGQLQDQARAAAAVQQEQSEHLARESGAAVAGISAQVERMIAASIDASQALRATVAGLSAATATAIDGMKAGADTLAGAAGQFVQAGQGMAGTLDNTAATMENVNVTANTLLAAAGLNQKLLDSHNQAQAAFAAMVADLKATVENARREASLTADLVDHLQAAAAQLAGAERKSEEYLDKVNDVLIQSHQAFADNIERTLRESNRQFQKELSQAVSLLSGAIQDLGDTLDELPTKRPPS